MNSLPNKNTSSCYKGVTRRKSGTGDRWISQIRHNQKTIRLGTFDTEKLAALAYNDAAIKLFGDYAKLNEI